MWSHVLRDAGAGVGDTQERHALIGSCRDRERPAVGHRVTGVDRQVEQGLVEPARIDLDGARSGRWEAAELDVRADQAPQHRMRGHDRLVEVEVPARARLLAAEGEQPARQVSGLGGRNGDLIDLVAQLVVRLADPVERELGIAGHGDQQVVEVMRDPARELADHLELLRLPQARFELPPLGDVAEDAVPLRLAVLLDQERDIPHPDVAAVSPVQAVLRRERPAVRQRQLLFVHGLGAVVRMDQRAPRRWMCVPLLRREADKALDCRADVVPAAGQHRAAVDDHRESLDEPAVALPRAFELRLGVPEGTRLRDGGEQRADVELAHELVAQLLASVDRIDVALPDASALDVASGDKLGENRLHGALGDADVVRRCPAGVHRVSGRCRPAPARAQSGTSRAARARRRGRRDHAYVNDRSPVEKLESYDEELECQLVRGVARRHWPARVHLLPVGSACSGSRPRASPPRVPRGCRSRSPRSPRSVSAPRRAAAPPRDRRRAPACRARPLRTRRRPRTARQCLRLPAPPRSGGGSTRTRRRAGTAPASRRTAVDGAVDQRQLLAVALEHAG